MDKKIAGLLGAVAGAATIGTAQAAIAPAPGASQALHASSYADLLAPVPDAVALLKADDAARAAQAAADPVQLAQAYYYPPYSYPYYNYHHHHRYYRYYGRYYNHHHHHHHHHHNNAFIGIPGVGGVVVRGR